MRNVNLCCSTISHTTQKHRSSLWLLCPGAGSGLWSQAVCGNSVPACSHELPKALSQALSHTVCCLVIREKATRGSSPFNRLV